MKKLICLLFILISSLNLKSQSNTPQNISLEDALVASIYSINTDYKVNMNDFNYADGEYKTEYYEYFRLLSKFRGKFYFKYQNGSFNILFSDIQMFNSSTSSWVNSSEGVLQKKEKELCTHVVESSKLLLKNQEKLAELKYNFFTNPFVIDLFCKKATSVAVEKWFEQYLKDKKINWSVTFNDIKKNDDGSKNYKYIETYSSVANNKLLLSSKFLIDKYTNSDVNTSLQKNTNVSLIGYCRSFVAFPSSYGNIYRLYLTDDIKDPIPNNSIQKKEGNSSGVIDNADKLLKLKELLDKGAITKEEYEKEKNKILTTNN